MYEVTAATLPFYEATTLDARAKSTLESELATLESVREAQKELPAGNNGALERAQQDKLSALYKTRAKYGV